MKRLIFAFMAIELLLFGCFEVTEEQVKELTQPDPDERTFLLDLGQPASWPVNQTIVNSDYSQGSAYLHYGRDNLTINECLALSDQSPKTLCLTDAAIYLNDISICEKLSGDNEIFCYYYFATQTVNATACDKVQLSYPGGVSMEKCKRHVALFTGDASLCSYNEAEQDGELKMELCQYFANQKTATSSDCHDELVPAVLTESTYFGKSIKWLNEYHEGEKVLAWWDYGLALKCAGMDAVTSKEYMDDPNIPYTAHLFTDAEESELVSFMGENNVNYLLMDTELISSPGRYLGGKYGALNFLSCAWSNETDEDTLITTSQCEKDHLWESVFVTSRSCDISANETGFLAYNLFYEDNSGNRSIATYYPSFCLNPDASGAAACDAFYRAEPVYCIGNTVLSDGGNAYAPYKLNETENGRLKLQKGAMLLPLELVDSHHFGDATQVTMFYTYDELWMENGNATSGYEDRTTDFYDSVLYKALFLESVNGLEEVYTESTGAVKIFALE